MRTTTDWTNILVQCGVKPKTVAAWAPVFATTVKADSFSQGDEDLRYFLGQVLHESAMLEKMEESLDYSAPRLMAVWPSRFKTLNDALPFARNPEALANKVYGGRMGNTQPGDGWLFRGRSLPGFTGRSTYEMLSNLMGQDFIGLPDLLKEKHFGLEATIRWWEGEIPDAFLGDVSKVRRRLNGGYIGLEDTQRITNLVEKALA